MDKRAALEKANRVQAKAQSASKPDGLRTAAARAAMAAKVLANQGEVLRASDALSLEECAERLGVTRQAVQQTERRAIVKVRAMLAKRGIALEDLLDDGDEPAHALFGDAMRVAVTKRR